MAVSAYRMSLLALAGVLPLIAASGESAASCRAPDIAGVWKRAAPGETQQLERLEIIHRCSPGQHGVHSVIDGQDWTLRAFAVCSPRACSWGRVPGAVRQGSEIRATFRNFSAYRHVSAVMRGDLLEVTTEIDWHSDARQTERATATFKRDE